QRREVIGIGVHIVAMPGLARAAMAAAVMGDTAVAAGGQKEHLVLKGVCAQWPAVAEDDGLSTAPVLVVDLRAVLGSDRGHGMVSLTLLHATAVALHAGRPGRCCEASLV